MKAFAVMLSLLSLLVAGCEYGPAHLDAFYAQRNHFQTLIDDIERRYSLPSRDADKNQVPALKDSVFNLQKENEILKTQVEVWKSQAAKPQESPAH